ncbi:hypothetical protein [Nitrosovibrio sp. Nv6]|uniref:hypothetical protein n=1 Tax=Nitrosovibrio sp. Nv6 TaxID=1855340 RepID=UPI00115F8466|nr:hypothetical protein [Nitrosovibrio sp. Nv6]
MARWCYYQITVFEVAHDAFQLHRIVENIEALQRASEEELAYIENASTRQVDARETEEGSRPGGGDDGAEPRQEAGGRYASRGDELEFQLERA